MQAKGLLTHDVAACLKDSLSLTSSTVFSSIVVVRSCSGEACYSSSKPAGEALFQAKGVKLNLPPGTYREVFLSIRSPNLLEPSQQKRHSLHHSAEELRRTRA